MFRTLKTGIAVAVATALEGLQQPVCLLLAFTAVELTILVPLVQLFSFGEGGRLARDSGLAILLVGGMLLAAFTSGSTLAREIASGTVAAAIGITAATVRFTKERIPEMARKVQAAVTELSRLFGHSAPRS